MAATNLHRLLRRVCADRKVNRRIPWTLPYRKELYADAKKKMKGNYSNKATLDKITDLLAVHEDRIERDLRHFLLLEYNLVDSGEMYWNGGIYR